jgi:shikimate dehydrogenase
MLKKFAVLGNPIAHSQTPQIHQAFAQQFNIELDYERILVTPGELQQVIQTFQNQGGDGVNLTLPLKEQAAVLMTELTPRAQKAGAVNTVIFLDNKKWRGDNTDGIGLLRDLKDNNSIKLTGKNILILGAGGAVRGILAPLLNEKPKTITIANRTLAKAQQLASLFSGLGKVVATDFTGLDSQHFDLIINATSASTKGEGLPLPQSLVKGSVCYDLAYGKNAAAFLLWAKEHGASLTLDGIGMLVEQAAEQFFIWHQKMPETHSVIQQLREHL